MALRNGSIETFENVTDVSVSSKWIQVIAAWIEQKQGKSFYSIETLPCKESKWIRFVLVNIFIFKYSCRNVLSYTSTWLGSFHIGSISQPFVINFYLTMSTFNIKHSFLLSCRKPFDNIHKVFVRVKFISKLATMYNVQMYNAFPSNTKFSHIFNQHFFIVTFFSSKHFPISLFSPYRTGIANSYEFI